MTDPILQRSLPQMPWMQPATARLPGMQPLASGDWLRVDEAHAGQMAERDRLIATLPDAVHALLPEALPAARELLELVLDTCRLLPGYAVGDGVVRRADGVAVALDADAPLLTLGRLVQEDFCLHLPDGRGEHALVGAILCFPASWTLSEKLGRPLTGIHAPVDVYDADLAPRVQRLFDALRPGRGLWRANALLYAEPDLFQPRRETDRRPKPAERHYLRSERQCLIRLPETGAVVFSIHTTVVHVRDVPPEALAAFRALHP
ncbi:MAG: heme-dependent oxidative N-demethylase family protein [Gemmobacter sp.]